MLDVARRFCDVTAIDYVSMLLRRRAAGLRGDPISLVERHNRSGDGMTAWPADYLEVVATRH